MGKLNSIQYGRALAAIFVVLAHVLHEAIKFKSIGLWAGSIEHVIPLGHGVDAFFVISGFIMAYIASPHLTNPGYAARFLKDRFFRVAPLYYIFSGLSVFLLYFLPKLFDTARFDIPHIVNSFLFFPGTNFENAQPIYSLGWTLNYEMFFYFLFSLSILFFRRWALHVVLGFLCVATVMHPVFSNGPFFAYFWTDPIILEFAYGMIIASTLPFLRARLCQRSMLVFLFASMLFTVLWALKLWGLPLPRFIFAGVPAALFIISLLVSNIQINPVTRIFATIGDASYSLYLSHPFVLSGVFVVWVRVFPDTPFYGVGFVIVSLLSSVAFSVVSYFYIERPIHLALKRRSFKLLEK